MSSPFLIPLIRSLLAARDYKYWTYSEFATIVKKVGSALVETGHSKNTIFNIYSGTSPRWQVMANGRFLNFIERSFD